MKNSWIQNNSKSHFEPLEFLSKGSVFFLTVALYFAFVGLNGITHNKCVLTFDSAKKTAQSQRPQNPKVARQFVFRMSMADLTHGLTCLPLITLDWVEAYWNVISHIRLYSLVSCESVPLGGWAGNGTWVHPCRQKATVHLECIFIRPCGLWGWQCHYPCYSSHIDVDLYLQFPSIALSHKKECSHYKVLKTKGTEDILSIKINLYEYLISICHNVRGSDFCISVKMVKEQ